MGGRCSAKFPPLHFPTCGKFDDEAEGPAGSLKYQTAHRLLWPSNPSCKEFIPTAMAHLWFILSLRWPLEDVQAVLNVLISVFSAIGIFTFARFCWQSATLHLTKQR